MQRGAVALRVWPKPSLLLLVALVCQPLPSHAAGAEFIGRFRWESRDARHGGFSGLELDEGGTGFTAISDRGWIVRGTLMRKPDGTVAGVTPDIFTALTDRQGRPMEGEKADAEGLVVRPDGSLFVSFEVDHRVWHYAAPGAPARPLPVPPAFRGLQNNSGLEALALGPDGALYTLPERSGEWTRPFPVFRYADGRWTQPFALPRRGSFLPVGADFGPDGRLYLLERRFDGLFGFASRVRRFTLGPRGPVREQTLFTSVNLLHDNLEGIAVWRDNTGATRLTLISDDNYAVFQHTEFVDYRVTE